MEQARAGILLAPKTLTFSTGALSKKVPLERTFRSLDPVLLNLALTLVFPTTVRLSANGESRLSRSTTDELATLKRAERVRAEINCMMLGAEACLGEFAERSECLAGCPSYRENVSHFILFLVLCEANQGISFLR